jgi:hypothetical protein
MGKCTLSVASRASTGGKHQRARPFPACTPPTAPAHAQRASRRLQCRVRTCSAVHPRCFPAPPAASPPRAASAASPPGCQCARSWTQTASSRSPVRSHRAPRVHGQRQEPLPAHGARPAPCARALRLRPYPCPARHLIVWVRPAVALVKPAVLPGVAPRQWAHRCAPCHRAWSAQPASAPPARARHTHARTHAEMRARARTHTPTLTLTHTYTYTPTAPVGM